MIGPAFAAASRPLPSAPRRRWFLGLLVAVGTCSAIDRVAVATMGPAIAADLGLSDFQLGLTSGFGFALLYAVVGLPLARLADKRNRVTLIAISVAIWSVFLILSGTVRNFAQLMICRVIEGVGEAGVQPPAVSLISDLYPKTRRGTALGIMALGVPLGTVIGSVGGGYLTELHGWRTALLMLGIPGLLLATIFWLTLREPPRGVHDPVEAVEEAPPISAVARLLGSKRSFWHLLVAIGLINIAVYGIGMFLPLYFTRAVGLSMSETGVVYGIVGAVSTIGFVFGGAITDRLGRRDERWHAWFCALGVVIGAPCYIIAFQIADPIVATALLTVGGVCMFLYFTPVQLILQNMVTPRMRATTAFVFFFVIGIVGAGLGPTFVGFVSDLATARAFTLGDYGARCTATGDVGPAGAVGAACGEAAAHGIQVALTTVSCFFVWAALHLLLAARTLRQDLLPPAERIETAAV